VECTIICQFSLV